MKKHSIALLLPILLLAGPHARADDPASAPAGSDSRIRMLRYDPNDIYTISTRVGYESYIEFAPHEEVEAISVGDRSFWQLVPSGNRLFIRPAKNEVSTNMTVITNHHAYQFDLKSLADPEKKIVYVARFDYPREDHARTTQIEHIVNPFAPQPPEPVQPLPQPQPQPQPPQATLVAPPPVGTPTQYYAPLTPIAASPPAPLHTAEIPGQEQRNYQYTFSGPQDAAPFEVFDSGGTTYFRYNPPLAAAPTAGIVQNDGTEAPVSVYQNGSYFAVDTVSGQLALHSDAGTAHLFNETLAH